MPDAKFSTEKWLADRLARAEKEPPIPLAVPAWSKRLDSWMLMTWDRWVTDGFVALRTDVDFGSRGWFRFECECYDDHGRSPACCVNHGPSSEFGNWSCATEGMTCLRGCWNFDEEGRQALDPETVWARAMSWNAEAAVISGEGIRDSGTNGDHDHGGLEIVPVRFDENQREVWIQTRLWRLIVDAVSPERWEIRFPLQVKRIKRSRARYNGPGVTGPIVVGIRDEQVVAMVMPVADPDGTVVHEPASAPVAASGARDIPYGQLGAGSPPNDGWNP